MFAGQGRGVALQDKIGAAFGAVFTSVFINWHRVRPPALKM
jgi:hypothetical protein